MWNARRVDTPFLKEYEKLLIRYGTDYEAVNHQSDSDRKIRRFFAPHRPAKNVFPNNQLFDLDGLEGRLQSSSYAPAPDHVGYADIMGALRQVFAAHQEDGFVNFAYDTEIYYGILPG